MPLSIPLNMYLAQKEAWEQQAEKMHREQPSTVVTQMGKPKYTPCTTSLEHGRVQFWKTYQDINILVNLVQVQFYAMMPVLLHICPGINCKPPFWPE